MFPMTKPQTAASLRARADAAAAEASRAETAAEAARACDERTAVAVDTTRHLLAASIPDPISPGGRWCPDGPTEVRTARLRAPPQVSLGPICTRLYNTFQTTPRPAAGCAPPPRHMAG